MFLVNSRSSPFSLVLCLVPSIRFPILSLIMSLVGRFSCSFSFKTFRSFKLFLFLSFFFSFPATHATILPTLMFSFIVSYKLPFSSIYCYRLSAHRFGFFSPLHFFSSSLFSSGFNALIIRWPLLSPLHLFLFFFWYLSFWS